jgi:hypothetical protein
MNNWKTWFQSLFAAAISAAASGVTLVIVAPDSFNFSAAGLQKLATVCGVNALLSVATFLKQSPLPTQTATVTTTVTATQETTKP